MSLLQPVPQACQNECSDAGTSAIPGPIGPAGATGADGAPGVSSVTTVDDYSPDPQPVMPAEGADETVDVEDSQWMVIGSIVFVQNWGWMRVTALPTTTSVTLENLEDTAAGEYTENAPPGTSLAAASRIGAGGMQGPEGAAAVGAFLVANNLNEGVPGTMRGNLGLGDVATLTAGTGTAEVVQNDSPLTDGDAVFATATGIETQAAATARTSLGLQDMATQDSTAVNIQGGFVNAVLGDSTPENATIDNLTVQGSTTIESDLTIEGKAFTPMSALQSLTVGNTISPSASKIRVEGSGGAVTLTSTPTITNPAADGQLLILEGNSDVNTLTLQDRSSLGGSNLNLAGGANVTLGQGDILMLTWSQVMGVWNEICRSNN